MLKDLILSLYSEYIKEDDLFKKALILSHMHNLTKTKGVKTGVDDKEIDEIIFSASAWRQQDIAIKGLTRNASTALNMGFITIESAGLIDLRDIKSLIYIDDKGRNAVYILSHLTSPSKLIEKIKKKDPRQRITGASAHIMLTYNLIKRMDKCILRIMSKFL